MTELMRDAVVEANGNWEMAFGRLAEHSPAGITRQFGPLTAVSTGIPVPFFNTVFVFEPPSRDDLNRAVSWLAGRDTPFQVTVSGPVLDATRSLATDVGLEETGSQPGMVLSSLDGGPEPDARLELETVTDAASLNRFAAVTAAAFEMPTEMAELLAPASILDDGTMRPLVGRVDGTDVACGLLVHGDDVAGVYNIGVVEEYRRRGLGEAMTWAVLRAGREAGCEMGALQSSEMGYSVYEGMGFETVVQYHHFQPV